MERTIVRHKQLLIELMDPDFGLLDELYACGNLQKREFDAIRFSPSTGTAQDRCERLLDCILQKSMVNELLSALERTNQTHLVNYIRADGNYKEEFNDDWPLGENERKAMTVNRRTLIDIMDHDICVYLFSNDVISLRQHGFIMSKLSKSDKNEALLEVMHRFSVKQFWKCVAGLRKWNLNHVATILSQSGAVVGLHANLQGSSPIADERDEIIAREMVNILHNGHRPILPEEWSRISSLVELKLFHARKGDSVLLYFYCSTIEELLRLHGLMDDGSLKQIIEEVFTQLLRSETTIVVSLAWSEGDFERGSLYFSTNLKKTPQVLAASVPAPEANLVKKPVPQVPAGKPSSSSSTASVSSMPEDTIVVDATWKGSLEESNALMKCVKEEGVFMIRKSIGGIGMTLQVYSDDVILKYKIANEGKKYQIAGGSLFDSMAELLTFYQTNNLPRRTTKLTKPYSKL